MASFHRGILLASLSVSILALGACASTGGNMSNQGEASRVDSILQRAAQEAKASGNKTDAVVLLEKIYQRNPDDAAVATSFAQSLREDDQLNRARQVLTPFTESKTPYPDAVTELSMVQLALGQYKEAELTARKAVELDPKSGRSFLALGTALDAQNYHEQAEVAFRRGIDNWKGDPTPIMNNLALNLASQNKLDQAIDMLKKAQEISPGRIELERNMRIITTLKESADDFIIKQEAQKNPPKAAPVKKAVETPAAIKPPVAKSSITTPPVVKAPREITKTEKPKAAPAKTPAPAPIEKKKNFGSKPQTTPTGE